MLYCDTRLGGIVRFRLSGEALMLVPDEVRQSVAFIGYRDQSGQPQLAGTGFFFASNLDDLGFPDRAALFLVTAHHVIDGIKKRGGRCVVRLNVGGKAVWFDLSADSFLSHPNHPHIETVDVAVAPVGVPPTAEIKAIPAAMLMTPDLVKQNGIGLGDEVFVSGLFWNHHGKERNLPIVRVGNIAGVPEEKVGTRFGEIDAYLVEARSIGGLSGSPVFVHLGFARPFGGQVKFAQNTDYGIFYLMGVMQGHFDSNSLLEADAIADATPLKRERVNMGIAIVTPISKVVDIMSRPESKRHRETVAEATRREQEKELPVMDSLETEPDFTKADFESALKKVSKKLSDEETSGT